MRVFSILLLLLHSSLVWSHECGKRVVGHSKSRILGGTEAPLGKWPWQILFKHIGPEEPDLLTSCGGTIIAERWILTAAHCLYPNGEVAYIIVGSVNNEKEPVTDENLINHNQVKGTVVHDEYVDYKDEKGQYLNDIALIELKEPLQFGPHMQPICLPSKNTTIPEDATAVATGFGYWNDRTNPLKINKTVPNLLETSFPLIPNDKCRHGYRNEVNNIPETQICGGSEGHRTAPGDSGSPVVMYSKDKKWFEIGITSWGEDIKDTLREKGFFPGVYTNVHLYCDWIEEKTGGEAKCIDAELVDATL